MISVENEVTLTMIDGKNAPVGSPKLLVRSVWNSPKYVEAFDRDLTFNEARG